MVNMVYLPGLNVHRAHGYTTPLNLEPINSRIITRIIKVFNEMKTCLVDASSAILLFKCGLFDDLLETYQVRMAAFVFAELTIDGYPGAKKFKAARFAGQVGIISGIGGEFEYQSQISPGNLLDRGEYDTICCFREGKGDFILTDDGGAARYCRDHDIPFINCLLFARLLYICGRLSEDEYRRRLADLVSKGRYSPGIVKFAGTSEAAELSIFLP